MLRDCKRFAGSALDGLLTVLGVLVHQLGLARPLIHLHRHSPKVLMYHDCMPVESDFREGCRSIPRHTSSHLILTS